MKTNLDNIFKTSKQAETEGIWLDLSETSGFLVRRFNDSNPQIRKAFATYYKPYARQIEAGTLDVEKEKEISIRVFVNCCLTDWKGIEIDGVNTPYSPEVAVKLFLRLPDLFKTLMEYAQDFSNYKEEVVDAREDLGNS